MNIIPSVKLAGAPPQTPTTAQVTVEETTAKREQSRPPGASTPPSPDANQAAALWERYKKYLYDNPQMGVRLDISRMHFDDAFIERMQPRIQKAFESMDRLEAGAIANPDENRMVGHYWLRNADMAPTAELRQAIESNQEDIGVFAGKIVWGTIHPQQSNHFQNMVVIGIGGSALGPEFVSSALAVPGSGLNTYFLDNTDPDGIDKVLTKLGEDGLKDTLTVVISKSGGTKETRNGMLEMKAAYERAGLDFGKHAVAVTGQGSELSKTATREGWIQQFNMWDWVGGRTSELSAVGLLPAALQGIDTAEMLAGAREMDEATRVKDWKKNPAAMLALMWYEATGGEGKKDMVVLPYKDSLELFSRYLQQLVMESLGKEKDLDGKVVHQGIAVYGNKGSTDQHAYVQQLREGVPNFFVTFIDVMKDRHGPSIEVDAGVTSGDYLHGFQQGTRRALYENGRESITLTLPDTSARSVGRLIALYERAVGYYGTLVNVNAYHQPGVEAGKKAAANVIDLQRKMLDHLTSHPAARVSIEELSKAIDAGSEVETLFGVAEHMAANGRLQRFPGATPTDATYAALKNASA